MEQTQTPQIPEQIKAMLPMLLAQIPEETLKGIAITKIQGILQNKLDKLFTENPDTNGIGFLAIPEVVEKKIVEVQIIIGKTNAGNTAIETPIAAFNLFDKINSLKKDELMKSIV